MIREAIADTGPIVALLDRSDVYHQWATECFKSIQSPIITCEAVFAEAWHLLGSAPPSRRTLAKLHFDGIIRVNFDFEEQSASVWPLLEKYQDVPMDLADACLVRLSELYLHRVVWTVDSDFKIYRRNKRAVIPLLAPWRL